MANGVTAAATEAPPPAAHTTMAHVPMVRGLPQALEELGRVHDASERDGQQHTTPSRTTRSHPVRRAQDELRHAPIDSQNIGGAAVTDQSSTSRLRARRTSTRGEHHTSWRTATRESGRGQPRREDVLPSALGRPWRSIYRKPHGGHASRHVEMIAAAKVQTRTRHERPRVHGQRGRRRGLTYNVLNASTAANLDTGTARSEGRHRRRRRQEGDQRAGQPDRPLAPKGSSNWFIDEVNAAISARSASASSGSPPSAACPTRRTARRRKILEKLRLDAADSRTRRSAAWACTSPSTSRRRSRPRR